ncbi:MAG: DUF502 domain-containing protein [Thiotrichales bacterium]
MTEKHRSHLVVPGLQRYLIAGILTVIPIWITFIVFDFIFRQLSSLGMPGIRTAARMLEPYAPTLATWLTDSNLRYALAALFTVIALYLLGWLATRVIGRRLLSLFDYLMGRIPFVQHIYGSTKKLMAALQQKPESIERVVLINFPSPEMRTVGLVTRVLEDERTGKQIAVVYVPTTPNPTSGYVELVPVEQLIATDWTLDEAMSFIVSGGTVSRDRVPFTRRDAAGDQPPTVDPSANPANLERRETADDRIVE